MRLALIIAPLAFAAAACSTTVSPAPGPPPPPGPIDGTLVLDWTINGTTDPGQCFQASADSIAVDVAFDTGEPAGSYQQSCTTFSTSISLAAGRYTATASLVDAAGNPRTTAVPINPFVIVGDDQLNIPIDFPASSFL